MKRLLVLFTCFLAMSAVVNAQDKKDNVKQDIKQGAKTVGNKTAEIASKGAARVSDKRYEGKQGPNGQTIYIDDNEKYYWINKGGHKVYISKGRLKNK